MPSDFRPTLSSAINTEEKSPEDRRIFGHKTCQITSLDIVKDCPSHRFEEQ